MNRLYQNIVIFFNVFSRNNPNGICRNNSKTCKIFEHIVGGLIFVSIITSVYFLLVGVGFLTSYTLNHQSYDIISGCPLNQLNCSQSQLFCDARNNVNIFLGCILTGLLGGSVIFLAIIIIIPILFGIFTIVNEFYQSFKNTKEHLEKQHFDIKLDESYQSFEIKELPNNIKSDDIEKLNVAVQS